MLIFDFLLGVMQGQYKCGVIQMQVRYKGDLNITPHYGFRM